MKTIIKYTNLKIVGECLGLVLGRARIDCHVDMGKHLDIIPILDSTEKKTIVFTSFVEVVLGIKDACEEQNLVPLCVYGDTNKQLNTILNTFTNDKAANPLIATYASLSTAVPLVMADTVILVDVPFRQYILDQAISRVHRLGSATQTHIYYMSLDTGDKPNISSRTFDILKWASKQVAEITGVDSPFTLEETKESIALESFYEAAHPTVWRSW